jgi:CRISPR-associated endoribonuclease Cas6
MKSSRFIVKALFRILLQDSVEMNLFSGRIVKSIIMISRGFEQIRNFYNSRELKPFRVTPLVYCRSGALAKGFIEAGENLCFEISYVSNNLSEIQNLTSVDDEIKIFSSKARIEVTNIEVVSLDNLTIGFKNPKTQLIKMVFETPTLLSTKLMTPPIPAIQRKISRTRTLYTLFPNPAHICSYLAKLWLSSFPETPLVLIYTQEWTPYLFGRICEITIAPIDYNIKPITIQYDEKRKIRGFIGWTIMDTTPIKKKYIEKLDKLLALANYLGLGKSRGIGFGKVKITTIQRKTQ